MNTKSLYEKMADFFSGRVFEFIRSPNQRIIFALTISIAIHCFVFWFPYINFPHAKILLPPLTVRLELLPTKETKSEVSSQAEVQPELVTHSDNPGGNPSGRAATNTSATLKKMEQSAVTQQFPRHLQLNFAVYKGSGGFSTGEVFHQLDIQSDKYHLRAVRKYGASTVAQQHNELILYSQGKVDEAGIRPDIFKEEVISAASNKLSQVSFDWIAQMLQYSNGENAALVANTQDVLSFMYQLSHISMQQEIIALPVTNGSVVENYEIEVGREEEIDTQMGKMRALHLRKLHQPGEAFFELWLGLEYRLLPVKFIQVAGSGEVIERMLISDIRASDE